MRELLGVLLVIGFEELVLVQYCEVAVLWVELQIWSFSDPDLQNFQRHGFVSIGHAFLEDLEGSLSSGDCPRLEDRSYDVHEEPGEERAPESLADHQHQSKRNTDSEGSHPPKAAQDEPAQCD
ncbi:hypothetical protein NPIL_221391 [Nephila pilipes]|uniref:Uncharacterized protein n=1 Tax=Nephila pilipes TaxID=299642 RepID=A0A8X6QVU5_NEPPI|nr:hypothetical protein NPIL_221391 [Nephila pilipes]